MARNGFPGVEIMEFQPTPSSPNLTGKYRRNGKLQSCEPCRKSHLACDHTVPVCRRCIKRRCTDQCVYHPNPLTQQRRQTPTPSLPTPSATCPTPHDSPQSLVQSIEHSIAQSIEGSAEPGFSAYRSAAPPAQTTGLRLANPPAPSSYHRAASAPLLDSRVHESSVSGNHGYVGVTSYSSIFSEGLDHVEAISEPVEDTFGRQMAISPDRILRGCEALAFLKDKFMVNSFIGRWYEICDGAGGCCIEPIMKEWLMKLWQTYGNILSEQQPDKLRKLSESIWRNSQTSLKFDGDTTALEWARLATGHNLRWVVVGLIASTIGLLATTLDASDERLKSHKITRQALVKKMANIVESCLGFCRENDVIDDMYIWLLLEYSGLLQAIKGDIHYTTYQATGETNNAVISMGLHQGSKPSATVPFFLAELRNRFSTATYAMEIGHATFLGRPPRLSYRYFNLVAPLDLTDHQICLEGPELAAALAELGEDGFNTVGRVTRATWFRTFLGMYPRREDILDLALGDYTREEVLQRAEVIERKIEEHWRSLPPFMVKFRTEFIDFKKLKPLDLLYRSALRQGARANDLLFQRVLIRKTGANPAKLIKTARDIFRDILLVTQRHDIASVFQMDVTSILTVHGLRSGAILAVELLKQEQQPIYPENPLLPRSQTIQDLSVFAARLGAVDPSDGAYGISQQGHKLVTRILDKILAPPKPPVPMLYQDPHSHAQMDLDMSPSMPVQGQGQGIGAQLAPPPPMIDTGGTFDTHFGLGNDLDFMQWLQNTDMERPDVWNTF